MRRSRKPYDMWFWRENGREKLSDSGDERSRMDEGPIVVYYRVPTPFAWSPRSLSLPDWAVGKTYDIVARVACSASLLLLTNSDLY
jgi:hypothetical protein